MGELQNIEVAVEKDAAEVEAFLKPVGTAACAALENLIAELPTLFKDVLTTVVPVVLAGVADDTPGAEILTAVESAAMDELKTQGVTLLDEQALAFKGALIAQIATTQAAASTAVPAAVATSTSDQTATTAS